MLSRNPFSGSSPDKDEDARAQKLVLAMDHDLHNNSWAVGDHPPLKLYGYPDSREQPLFHIAYEVRCRNSRRDQPDRPHISKFCVVGAGTFLGPPGQTGAVSTDALAMRTANANRLMTASKIADDIDKDQLFESRVPSGGRIVTTVPVMKRHWVPTVDPQPERNFWLADKLVLSKYVTSGSERTFSVTNHTPTLYEDAFVYNLGVNPGWLRTIIKSRPQALLGPPITPDLWQDQPSRDMATDFLQAYSPVDVRQGTSSGVPSRVDSLDQFGVTTQLTAQPPVFYLLKNTTATQRPDYATIQPHGPPAAPVYSRTPPQYSETALPPNSIARQYLTPVRSALDPRPPNPPVTPSASRPAQPPAYSATNRAPAASAPAASAPAQATPPNAPTNGSGNNAVREPAPRRFNGQNSSNSGEPQRRFRAPEPGLG